MVISCSIILIYWVLNFLSTFLNGKNKSGRCDISNITKSRRNYSGNQRSKVFQSVKRSTVFFNVPIRNGEDEKGPEEKVSMKKEVVSEYQGV